MSFTLELDHVVVVARTLDEGRSYVEALLGTELFKGGEHPDMGTHNLLLSLGDSEYLEVIAIDPDAPRPPHRRWFNLDTYSGAPRLMNWVCRTDDLDAALAAAPSGSGSARTLRRGQTRWRMGVSDFGRLPFDDASPALMEWDDMSKHPCRRLPDVDLRLSRLDVFHPEADGLLAAFPILAHLPRVSVRHGPEKRLIATIRTPEGNRILA